MATRSSESWPSELIRRVRRERRSPMLGPPSTRRSSLYSVCRLVCVCTLLQAIVVTVEPPLSETPRM